MQGRLVLGGPVWLFATVMVLVTIGLMVFVLADSLRATRAAAVAGRLREPLLLYTGLAAAYLLLLVFVQVAKGVQFASAIVVLATPSALALGVTYLLRAVFPRGGSSSGDTAPSPGASSDSGGAHRGT